MYYTAMEHLLKVFDEKGRSMPLKLGSIDEYLKWKEKVLKKLYDITGLDRMESCGLMPEILETAEVDGFIREKWLIRTEPDVYMPFYVLKPKNLRLGEKHPCVVAPHGHDSGGKCSVAGRKDIPAVSEKIREYNYVYGLRMVKEGYVVFCPDARAFGERREWTGQGEEESLLLKSTCVQLNHMAICLGQSVTGMWTWDMMRLVDYIQTRIDCDGERIGCLGLSGGGLQTLWLSALDERIKCAAVSGYFYGYRDALLKLSDNCGCNYVPHLWEYVDMGDIGALIAPRPLLIESGTRDPLNGERGLDNAAEQVDITRQAYKLFGAEERLRHYVFDGVHRWDGAVTYDFFKKWLY